MNLYEFSTILNSDDALDKLSMVDATHYPNGDSIFIYALNSENGNSRQNRHFLLVELRDGVEDTYRILYPSK